METNKKVLIIVDPQNDFIEGGALPVSGGTEVLTRLAEYLSINANMRQYEKIYVSKDWHPENHMSFKENGGIWPAHCVAGTLGAEVYGPLKEALNNRLFTDKVAVCTKGVEAISEQYSVFCLFDGEITNPSGKIMYSELCELKPDSFDVCGLAGDYCVRETIQDLITLFPDVKVNVLSQFIASIDGGEKLKTFVEENHLNYIE